MGADGSPTRGRANGALGYLLYAGLALAALAPYLTTGYYCDDSANSTIRGMLALKHQTLGSYIGEQNRMWMFERGRLYPLSLYFGYPVFYWIHDLLTYRIVQLALVLANLLGFVALIQALGGSRKLSLMSGLIVLTLFQLRNYHDPVSSYVFLMQMAMGLGISTLLLFVRFKKSASAWALIGSFIFYACALLFYEADLAFSPVLFYLAMSCPRSRRWARLSRWGHLALTGFYFGGVGYLRWAYPLAYNGTRSSLGLRTLTTFLRQGSGALPMVYSLFGRSDFYTFGTLVSSEFLTRSALAIWMSGSAFCYWVLVQPGHDELRQEMTPAVKRVIRWLALMLILVPTALVSLSEKYQEGIDRPGMAYLPVYLSCFGVALLAGIWLFATRRPKRTAAFFGAMLAFTFSCNQIAADHLNRYWRYPREILEVALSQGLLSSVEPDARIVRFMPDSWDWARPEFLYQSSGRNIQVSDLAESLKQNPRKPGEKIYLLSVDAHTQGKGRVLLASFDQADWDPEHKKLRHLSTSVPARVMDFEAGKVDAHWLAAGELSESSWVSPW